ncbi:MAG: phenylalanine--tRNA ligase subunit beta [Gammaproteobacteria bacterium]|nr:phenylalanine--tRNA ligase subunit beta [Gammaproteobacteria bacterium]
MKLPISWLSEWIEHGLEADALAQRLTLLGLEVDGIDTIAASTGSVVVGKVLETRRHPDADRLTLCRVDVGGEVPVDIVCGAPNVRTGGHYPTALPGARLPVGVEIRATTLRGQPSAGMLCSGSELGLADQPDGLLELDSGCAPGASVNEVLALGDSILEINVTPNRADCLSVAGIAREVAAATGKALRQRASPPTRTANHSRVDVRVDAAAGCSRFAARIVRGIRNDAPTPAWLRERLRRAGMRTINPVVDVTNYVCMELGQPMHAYDLGRLQGALQARRARNGESIQLLDGRTVGLDGDTLVIADDAGPLGMAGIMGGQRTAVETETRDICFEAAWFAREAIAGRARRHGLVTEASIRFERGVDPTLQATAIERATELLVAIAGGEAGPICDRQDPAHPVLREPVRLRRTRLHQVLGLAIDSEKVGDVLRSLGMTVATEAGGWLATPPAARFDIEREEDLIEEVARVVGYDSIPSTPGRSPVHPAAADEIPAARDSLVAALIARGYQEAITYSFVEPGLASRLGARPVPELVLSNPISADLAVMRQSLWPGLLKALGGNLARQQDRVRLFEIGTRFVAEESGGYLEDQSLAFAIAGSRYPTQWGTPSESGDFYDAKAVVEALLQLSGAAERVQFLPAEHPALHPGRTAALVDKSGNTQGLLGELHPVHALALELPGVLLFECSLDFLCRRHRPAYVPVSRFPAIHRDIAVVVPREVPAAAILQCVRQVATSIVQSARIFDIYTGRQMAASEKSVAIGLILQDTSRTLTVEDADDILGKVIGALRRDLKARIRE